jgi:signal transduction histidine kinase
MAIAVSLRRRLTLISGMVIAVTLAVAALGLVLIFERYIERRVGQELRDRLLEIAGAFELDGTGKPQLARQPVDPRYNRPYGGAYWYVRAGDEIPLRSRSLWDGEITLPQGRAATIEPADAKGPGGSEVYAFEKEVLLGEGPNLSRFILGVALDHAEIKALSQSFGTEVGLGLALIGAVLVIGAWLQAGYGLQPLARLRGQLAGLHRGEGQKLAGPFPEEVAALGEDLNTLFERQKEMLQRARERAGTLAHGLKTPLTILTAEARRLENKGDKAGAAGLREQIEAIKRLVERELARARAHGSVTGLGGHADPGGTIERLVGLMKRMPRGDAIAWNSKIAPGAMIRMDPDDFGEVLGNLLDNARKWARTTVEISISTNPEGSMAVSVSDDGPGIAEEDRQTMLERGVMGVAHPEDSGLGLSIAREVLSLYSSQLSIENSALGGAKLCFVIHGAGPAR